MRRTVADVRGRLPSSVALAGATALVLAGAAGWSLGGASREAPPLPNAVTTVDALRLEVEPTWVRAASVPGLPVADAEVLAPAPGVAERALLVTGVASDATLIPAALRVELPASLPEPKRTRLGGLAAWTYGPMLDEGRMVEVTVAPTTTGVLALACSAPAASWGSWASCSRGVHAVASDRAEALAPTADLAFRQAAVPVLATLDERPTAARKRLSKARGPAPAAALAEAHRRAGGAPGDTVAALREAARAYASLAAASRGGLALQRQKRSRFIAARGAVTRAEGSLAAALAELR